MTGAAIHRTVRQLLAQRAAATGRQSITQLQLPLPTYLGTSGGDSLHPPGMGTLAGALGIAESSLQNKVSITNHAAHCSPEEMARIMDITGDHGALHALNARLGYVAMALPQLSNFEDDSAVQLMTTTIKEFGELMAEASADLANGRVTDNQMARISKEGIEAIAAIQQLLSFAQQRNDASKPAAVRGGTLRAA